MSQKWVPDPADLHAYLKIIVMLIYKTDDPEKIEQMEKRDDQSLPPLADTVKRLKDKIETDPKFYLFFNQMFNELPYEYIKTMFVRNYRILLRVISYLITMPPIFTKHHVGCPINGVLTWPMGTVSGYAAFLDDEVNAYIGEILSVWKDNLQKPASVKHLNETEPYGWFSPTAMASSDVTILVAPCEYVTQSFFDVFEVDDKAPNYGFTSWDAYFTRQLKDGARPVESPHDNNIIANACESAPYKLSENVKEYDTFWVKTQNYSMKFMLNNDPLAPQFYGGTVYQGFLSNMNYHRFHSPVNGIIVKQYLVKDGFYTESHVMGYDSEGDNQSQGYLTETQTRLLYFIQAENSKIGLMCLIAVGMGDVSSCESFVKDKQPVKKGEQIGTFHIGGSTHCLVFRPGVNVTFDLRGQRPSLNSAKIAINSKIASVA